ncbi:hypothetical protein [Brevundimonas sp.]|uniref:hypothetical protein n=1 Tax=Brevundimonas sp. TaxID=1871086 RepID=UPI002D45396D|nr:hypothetical protein [Brevundimonas sp.]HYC74425.1 hypothetical protein [Brevundimonas sp.]
MRPPFPARPSPPAPDPSPRPSPKTPARLLHVRCLRPGCGREALFNPDRLFGDGPRPAEGLSRRFVCACGRRAAHLSYVSRRPRPDNPCGWL